MVSGEWALRLPGSFHSSFWGTKHFSTHWHISLFYQWAWTTASPDPDMFCVGSKPHTPLPSISHGLGENRVEGG